MIYQWIKILVTGANGFLGKWLCRKLYQHGYRNIAEITHKQYELTNIRDAYRLMSTHKPDVVIHLAARVGGIGANRNAPAEFFSDNIRMGINVINAAKDNGVERFVLPLSVCCYPKFTPVPFKEEDIWNGYPEETNAPYGIAKRALMVMLQTYREQYNFDGVSVIPTNLYGPGDNYDLSTSHVIPAMIRKFFEATKDNSPTVTLWGDGESSRDFLYVEDCAEGIIQMMESYDQNTPVNLGTGIEVKIADLAKMIADEAFFRRDIIWNTSMPNGQPRRCLDISKAKLYGFEPKTSLYKGLCLTIRDYYANASIHNS